ncbi:rho guanine nucleotide exchange factor 37 isoform X2 [Boleophthalmus pectinirostris]|uniref:rho guanine nucleotide exchange factor 37 isoform X2 n=1 Tax=Boleophthalmus pectinirostris TaxID=150288 RepID=UPI00242FFA21|nr:rho guanine nucleotide exchange factor 37 isoform X2 [Boleophthalmus pectinirostris]
MEVPPRPQPPTLLLPMDRPMMPDLLQDHDQLDDLFSPEDEDFFGGSDESTDLLDCNTSVFNMSICSQDSFIELKEQSDEDQRKSEEEKCEEIRAQRQNLALLELLESERNYLRMLQLSSGTIKEHLLKMQPPLLNVEPLFEHLPGVVSVTSQLLNSVDQEQLQPGDPDFLQNFCNSFLRLAADMETAYKEYLSNYSQVTAWEVSCKQKEALWDQIVKVLKSSAPELKASSLSFFLVMPVQRIARYPLLLQTILKHTDPSHPSYGLLEQTAQASVYINCRINEYKRIREFREVADKYKKTETLSIKDMINRLNTHSIFKKTARLSQQIKHETGIVPKLVDEEFDALEGFFYLLEKCILELLENVETYLNHLQVFLSCKTEEFDLYMDAQREAVCYKEITTALRQWILPMFEKRLRALIHKPLCALRDLLVGPRNLIRKRLDKLLDYELIEAKSNLSYEEQATANTYKTMNTLLLTELPRFNTVSLQLIWRLLGTFSCLHRDLASDMTQLFQTFATQLPHSGMSPSAFWEWAEATVMEGMRKLQDLCQTVEEALSAPVTMPVHPCWALRYHQLCQKHPRERIFEVTCGVVGSRDLDLSLIKGELVAVVSERDSKGDRRRWLVDAGVLCLQGKEATLLLLN